MWSWNEEKTSLNAQLFVKLFSETMRTNNTEVTGLTKFIVLSSEGSTLNQMARVIFLVVVTRAVTRQLISIEIKSHPYELHESNGLEQLTVAPVCQPTWLDSSELNIFMWRRCSCNCVYMSAFWSQSCIFFSETQNLWSSGWSCTRLVLSGVEDHPGLVDVKPLKTKIE